MLLIVTYCTFKKPDGPLHCECLNTKPPICCLSQLPQHTGSLRFLDSIPAVLSGSQPVASSSQGHIEKQISDHLHFQLIVDKEWRVKKITGLWEEAERSTPNKSGNQTRNLRTVWGASAVDHCNTMLPLNISSQPNTKCIHISGEWEKNCRKDKNKLWAFVDIELKLNCWGHILQVICVFLNVYTFQPNLVQACMDFLGLTRRQYVHLQFKEFFLCLFSAARSFYVL